MEEGEIVDYDPLPRPTVYGSGAMSMKYSDNSGDENDSVDSDSGNDSDSPGLRAKKPKLKKCGADEETTHPSSKQSKYNIWCSELQETSLTEDLVNCDVRNKEFDRSRDVESYNYKLAYTMDDQQENSVDSYGSKSGAFTQGVKRRYRDRGSVKIRLGKRLSDSIESDGRGSPRNLFDLNVTVENTNEEVACDIANKLCEEKDDLIMKVVEVLGKEKAIEIFKETKNIEEDGGMMVLNNSRRRTPGGVFLLLVKQDDDIQQEKLNLIFTDDRKKTSMLKKRTVPHSRKARAEELRKSLSADGVLGDNLPALLTRSELLIQERHKHCETDGVTNPPPSPATDGRENSSDWVPEMSEPPETRQLSVYDDSDVLDVTCDMDVF